ncbi:MAG TPA: glycerol-3-phosphate acyltransferase, partial [Thermoanaerobaculia bacterium]
MAARGRRCGGADVNPAAALLVVVGYLLGSLSFAVIVVRLKTGKDIRAEGSGNAGA